MCWSKHKLASSLWHVKLGAVRLLGEMEDNNEFFRVELKRGEQVQIDTVEKRFCRFSGSQAKVYKPTVEKAAIEELEEVIMVWKAYTTRA